MQVIQGHGLIAIVPSGQSDLTANLSFTNCTTQGFSSLTFLIYKNATNLPYVVIMRIKWDNIYESAYIARFLLHFQ